MRLICEEVPGCKIANIVEGGLTPNLSMNKLEEIGYNMAVYPLTALSSAMIAMVYSLYKLKIDDDRSSNLMSFNELRRRVGFDNYYEVSSRYETSKR